MPYELKEIDSKEKIVEEIKELVAGIGDGNIPRGIYEAFYDSDDKNFLNILAVKFHSQVINNGTEKGEIKKVFAEVMKKTDKYLALSGRSRKDYNKINSDFGYLFN